MEPVYTPVIGAAVGLFKAMRWTVHVSGAHNIPLTGPAILASNHIGYLDFVVVGYGAREADRLVRFAAKQEVFEHSVAGPLMRGMKHLPVDRDGDAMAIMRLAKERLALGQVIGMFPEGTISRSFMPAQGKTGTARMALESGVPLIPTAVWGCQRLSTKAVTKNIERNIEIRVTFGPPIPYDQDDEPRDLSRRLMEKITGLVVALQEAYTQVPAGPEDSWWQPAHLGGSAPTPEEAEEMIRQERIERRRRRKAEREGGG
ncbi:lysophospholipid acyltransferase family protein [Euzebya tangerina]|uniref:lysophospholipid acyltransferase family protein n=1 Tax=Euzebya tangerina TaxID=591198 RepID=UPI000E30D612|nr:lysophospholipid acyltransferase family protein [Euzebya tangerina]